MSKMNRYDLTCDMIGNGQFDLDEYGNLFPSSPGSCLYIDMAEVIDDEANAQLAAAGPVGVAAACAISSSRKSRLAGLYSFESNPTIRRRVQKRLTKKLRKMIDEYTVRVGQQAIVLITTPGQPSAHYNVFGAQPLQDVIKGLEGTVMEEFEIALAHESPTPMPKDPTLFELPPFIIDGIPTPVEAMTQIQLRKFIPLMIKYSTGRGKPNWDKEASRPVWWPKHLPWANIRMDRRSKEEKEKVPWTNALRKIVISCYKYHKREDLFPVFPGNNTNADPLFVDNLEHEHETVISSTINENSEILQLLEIENSLNANTITLIADDGSGGIQGRRGSFNKQN